MHRTRITSLLFAAALAACSPSNTADTSTEQDSATDTATPTDTAAPEDTSSPADAPIGEDVPTPPVDATSPTDATAPTDVPVATDVTADTASDAPAPGDAMTPACVPPTGAAPDLMGPGACGTLEFGQPAVPVATVAAPIVFTGGAIPPGVYDVVRYSRTTGSLMTTMRATLVISADGRFSEIRVLDTGSGMPNTTRKSGTYTIEDTSFVRSIPCGGTGSMAMPETNRLPFKLECSASEVLLHMGTTNLWFTYRRR